MRGDAHDTKLLSGMDPELRAGVLAMREREAKQEAEKALIRKWRWERLVPPAAGQRRRQRHAFTVELHPSGWPPSPGSASQKSCASIGTGPGGLNIDEYRAFHGEDQRLHPVVWKVRTGAKSATWEHVSHFCDAHLPAEYRPAEALAEGVA